MVIEKVNTFSISSQVGGDKLGIKDLSELRDISFEYLKLGDDLEIDRFKLSLMFPHEGIALMPSYVRIENGACSSTLERCDSAYYEKGHPGFFPMHWLLELAAQTLGLQVFYELAKVPELVLPDYSTPSFMQPGHWLGRPPGISLETAEPIVATAIPAKLAIRKRMRNLPGKVIKAVGDVDITCAGKCSRIEGIEIHFYSKAFLKQTEAEASEQDSPPT